MTVDPDPLSERTETVKEVEEPPKDCKGPLDYDGDWRNPSLRDEEAEGNHIGHKAVDGDPKSKLQEIRAAKEADDR